MSRTRFRTCAAALSVCFASLAAASAHATGGVECHAPDDADIAVTLILGAAPVTPVLQVRARLGAGAWSTQPGEEARRWSLAQGFVDARSIAADLVDEQSLERIAAIRILRPEEEPTGRSFGYLQMHGKAAHPLVCIGP